MGSEIRKKEMQESREICDKDEGNSGGGKNSTRHPF